jgi:hypothetical protein
MSTSLPSKRGLFAFGTCALRVMAKRIVPNSMTGNRPHEINAPNDLK